MNDRWKATHEWMGHIQDELRLQGSKLDRIISMLQGRESDAEALRTDHETLAKQVQEHERRLPPR